MAKDKIKIFYLLSFLGGFSFNIIVPFFVVFGLSLKLTIAQVGLLFGAMHLSTFIFEVPTGIFADSYGRKKSVLMTYFLTVFSSLIYFFASNLYFLLIGSIIYGMALTFMTGAFEALAVDSLKLSDNDNLRDKFFIRMGVITTIGFTMGGFVGSVIAYFNLRYIWLAHAIISGLALFFGWIFLEEKFYSLTSAEQDNFVKTIFNKFKKPLVSIFKDKKISLMYLIVILISFASALYFVSWPIIFKDILSIPVYYFGSITSIAGLFFLVGSLLAERFSTKKGTVNTIIFCLALMGLFYVVFGFSKSIVLSLLSFMLIDFFNGGFNPLFYSLFNKFIPSRQRATLLSFYSLVGEGSSGVGEVIAGSLLVILAAPSVMILSFLLILLALIIFAQINYKSKSS